MEMPSNSVVGIKLQDCFSCVIAEAQRELTVVWTDGSRRLPGGGAISGDQQSSLPKPCWV